MNVMKKEMIREVSIEDRRICRDILHYGKPVIDSGILLKAEKQHHHKHSNLLDHTLEVTINALRIAYALELKNKPVDLETLVISALCHDLGLLGRDEKYTTPREIWTEHPEESIRIMRSIFPERRQREEEIVAAHMWPLTPGMPKSREALVLSLADKSAAVLDWVRLVLKSKDNTRLKMAVTAKLHELAGEKTRAVHHRPARNFFFRKLRS